MRTMPKTADLASHETDIDGNRIDSVPGHYTLIRGLVGCDVVFDGANEPLMTILDRKVPGAGKHVGHRISVVHPSRDDERDMNVECAECAEILYESEPIEDINEAVAVVSEKAENVAATAAECEEIIANCLRTLQELTGAVEDEPKDDRLASSYESLTAACISAEAAYAATQACVEQCRLFSEYAQNLKKAME